MKTKPKKKPIELQASKASPRKGPEPERLKLEGNWIDNVNTALKKKRPPTDWPK